MHQYRSEIYLCQQTTPFWKIHLQKQYLDFLRDLLKDQSYVALAYMTGILPVKKYGVHSALNMFREYSMTDQKMFEEYTGFTETEVQALCRQYDMDFEETNSWYDGYRLRTYQHIYNPKSVADVLMWKEFRSYWTGTETYEALKIYIDMNFDGLKEAVVMMLGNGRCRINTRKFQNDMTTFKTKDDVLTLLIHLGYLTYDKNTDEVFIPNLEITQEFMNVVDEPGWDGLVQSLNHSEELLQSTWDCDENAVAEKIATIHNETASMLKYNDENSLTCVILMAYYSAKAHYMNPIMELPSGKGFADVVYLPKRERRVPALVVELKWNKTAKGAIDQIKEKRYPDAIRDYGGELLLVGISYNKDAAEGKRKHTCMIEKLMESH